MTSLRITEIFHSLQGEAATVGLPTAFVRLTGCPLRCQYCDTAYAFSGGEMKSIEKIVEEVGARKVEYVTVTGGEPLAQPECGTLMSRLADEGYKVSIETSGAFGIEDIDKRVSVVMDIKTPASGEVSRNRFENVSHLTHKDQVKFVICSRADYEWSRFKVAELQLNEKVGNVLFSASHEQLDSVQLAEWILADELPVRLQVQLHKLLWGDKPGV